MNKLNIFFAGLIVGLLLLLTACTPTPTPSPATDTSSPVPPTDTSEPPTSTPVPPTQVPTETSTALPTSSGLTFIVLDMLNEVDGWAMTNTNAYRTEDSGETWMEVSPQDWAGETAPFSGFFRNADHAWLLQSDPIDFERGVFYHTSDGGASWLRFEVPFGAGSMSFIDNRTGWVMTGLGAGAGSMAIAIFATKDGGMTWSEVYRRDTGEAEPEGEIPLVGSKVGITFSDAQRGWVAGSIPADNFSYLYASENGGANFQQQEIPMPPGIETAMLSLEAPVFYNLLEGILPVYVFTPDLSQTIFYTTVDGGQTWAPTTPVPVLGRYSIPTPSDYFCWDGITLFHSTNGGLSWDDITPNINLDQMIAALDFVDAENGWVTWMDGEGHAGLYRTSDGGETWEPLP